MQTDTARVATIRERIAALDKREAKCASGKVWRELQREKAQLYAELQRRGIEAVPPGLLAYLPKDGGA